MVTKTGSEEHEVVSLLRAEIEDAGSAPKLCIRWQGAVSASYLMKMAKGSVPISDKVLECLGLRRVTLYQKVSNE